MNARGSTEVIVATIGLSMGALSQNLYTMIVAMAVVTTMVMPTLRWALGRLPMREGAGAARAGGVRGGRLRPQPRAPTCRRGRESQSRFAARLAGLLAGLRGMPVTVLGLGMRGPDRTAPPPGPNGSDLAGLARAFEADTRKTLPAEVKVLTRVPEAAPEEAVASEARKGYGLLVVGVDRAVGAEGGFHEDVARMASGFHGPLAVAVPRGVHVDGQTQTCGS